MRPNEWRKLIVVISPIVILLALATVVASTLSAEAESLLIVAVVDVGQGDAIWLKTPDGVDMLVDGGPPGQGDELLSFLEEQIVTDIEVMVLTHADTDHVGGLNTILENMTVVQAWLGDAIPEESNQAYEEFLDLLQVNNVATGTVRAGDVLPCGNVISVTVLNPPEPLMTGTNADDNNSVVLLVSYGDIDFLLTGDTYQGAEEKILEREPVPDLDAEVLKVAHHGSAYASSSEFLSRVGPEIAAISVGRNNSYGHPAVETLSRLRAVGATLYRTDRQGTIIVTSDGSTYWVTPEWLLRYMPFILKGITARP
jgi:competence protein ComEC